MYLRQAARKAAARWAYREAARYLELALEAVGRLPRRADTIAQEVDVRLELRAALIPQAGYDRIGEILPAAVAMAEHLEDRERLVWALASQAHMSVERRNFPQALESGRRALALAEEAADPVLDARRSVLPDGRLRHAGRSSASDRIGAPDGCSR